MENWSKIQGVPKKYLIIGELFSLANRMETMGNSPDYLGELTAKQWFFLANLNSFFETPPTITQLANQIGTSRQNVKTIAEALQKKGFIKLERDQHDARAWRVHPCEKCRQYEMEQSKNNDEFVNRFMSVLTDSEIDTLEKCLYLLIDQTDKMKGNDSK